MRDAAAGLIAHYPFDEGSGADVRDVSGNGFHGTTSAARAEGVVGGALRFDGITRATIPYRPGFTWGNANRDFSITYWIRVDEGPTGEWRNVFHKGLENCGNGDRTSAAWLYPQHM